jgi:hypothetical protein
MPGGIAAGLALLLAVPAGTAPVPPLRPASLLGRWADHGDCSKAVIFRGDGTFLSYAGGEGTWRLAGNRLTMTGSGGNVVVTVRRLPGNRLEIRKPDGSVGISQRC